MLVSENNPKRMSQITEYDTIKLTDDIIEEIVVRNFTPKLYLNQKQDGTINLETVQLELLQTCFADK